MKTAIFIALLVLAAVLAGCTTEAPAQETPQTTIPPVTEQPATLPPEVPAAPIEPVLEGIIDVPDDLIEENPDPGALNDVSVDTRTLG